MATGDQARDGVFAMPIDAVYEIPGRGTALEGQIAQGTVQVGDSILVIGGAEPLHAAVFAIRRGQELTTWADAGDHVGLMLKDVASVAFSAGMLVTSDPTSSSVESPESQRQYGIVKWFNWDKGFGFIEPADRGQDVFVHVSSLAAGMAKPQEGDPVEFSVFWGEHGPMAQEVRSSAPNESEPRSATPPGINSVTPHPTGQTRYEGRDCTLTLTEQTLLIVHKSMRERYVPVELSRLSDVHYEPATRWTSGIITIAIDGLPLHVPTGTNVGGAANTIVFKSKSNATFASVHDWLQRVIADNRG